MVTWVRSTVGGLLIAAVALAVWKFYGGDLQGFFSAIWGLVYTVLDGVSNVLVSAAQTVLGDGGSAG